VSEISEKPGFVYYFAILKTCYIEPMQRLINIGKGNLDFREDMKRAILLSFVAVLFLSSQAPAAAPSSTSADSREAAAPATPRELYNAGTRHFKSGKLREAEALLETALASQDEGLQTPVLYNLGHIRFSQGKEELKKGPSAKAAVSRSEAAVEEGGAAVRDIDDALASNEMDKMVAAYLHGRGKRHELKTARAAVLEALKAHQATLAKWERSTGDFKSAVELDSSQADARFNSEVVDRRIAQLVDSLRKMQQQLRKCNGMCDKLGAKMKQLKGRIPGSQVPGGPGDEEEDEDAPTGPPKDQKEVASKDGKENKDMLLSPEQAAWLLEGFKLDSERRLPMGQEKSGQPRTRSLKPW
jgi:TolA-binding protein